MTRAQRISFWLGVVTLVAGAVGLVFFLASGDVRFLDILTSVLCVIAGAWLMRLSRQTPVSPSESRR